jgi:catechol 2,3-dioxygenase-like lactoylglutathione lyase family enzyme
MGDGVSERSPIPLGHIGITVPDVDAAVAWYRQVFGWRLLMGPVEVSTDDPNVADQIRDVFGDHEVAFRQAHLEMPGGAAIELFGFHSPRRTEGRGAFEFWRVGTFHICVVEPEIESLAARIEAQGGRRRTAIHQIFPGEPYRFCYCEDPYGNIIEIATHPHAEAFGGRSAY